MCFDVFEWRSVKNQISLNIHIHVNIFSRFTSDLNMMSMNGIQTDADKTQLK